MPAILNDLCSTSAKSKAFDRQGSAGILPACLLFKKGGRDARQTAGETPALLNEKAASVLFHFQLLKCARFSLQSLAAVLCELCGYKLLIFLVCCASVPA
jgi:hypothetical protein